MWRVEMTCPQSHRKLVANVGAEPRSMTPSTILDPLDKTVFPHGERAIASAQVKDSRDWMSFF